MKHQPTQEQQYIIDSAKVHHNLRINAYSGAGKTSTLTMLADSIQARSLYICFNRVTADEAKGRFPDYVKCSTSHSVAYADVGYMYRHKLSRPTGKYQNVGGTSNEVAKLLKIPPVFRVLEAPTTKELVSSPKMKSGAKKRIDTCVGAAIRATLTKFEQSADTELSIKHVEYNDRNVPIETWDVSMTKFACPKELVLHYAKELWAMRVDKENEILIGHDTYLKIWQLSNPRLDDIYDVIYLDEAQDSNPCLLDVLYKQSCRLVFVGDQYQSIYSWRGAVNAMTTDGGKEWHNCLLSTSFRYGKSIADIANKVLNIPLGTDLSVKGVKPQDKVVNHYGSVNMLDGQVHTRIYRTNHNLLSDAIILVTNNVKCSIELDLTDFIKMLESALALYQNRMNDVKHDSVAPYMSWEEFVMDADNKLVTTIVSSGQAQNVISVLRLHRNNPKPVVTLTTAHKSKGREWDTVWLNNDFPDVSVANGKPSFVSDEERNLMYVAATRAKHTLYYNRTISRII